MTEAQASGAGGTSAVCRLRGAVSRAEQSGIEGAPTQGVPDNPHLQSPSSCPGIKNESFYTREDSRQGALLRVAEPGCCCLPVNPGAEPGPGTVPSVAAPHLCVVWLPLGLCCVLLCGVFRPFSDCRPQLSLSPRPEVGPWCREGHAGRGDRGESREACDPAAGGVPWGGPGT